MYKQKKFFIWAIAVILLMLVACSSPTETTSTIQTNSVVNTTSDSGSATTTTTSGDTAVSTTTATLEEVAASHTATHEDETNYLWDESQTTMIVLAGDSISVEGSGVTVNGRIATITSGGTYELSGSLSEGQIVVDSDGETAVQLILNGIEISNSSTAPIYIANAPDTIIILAEGSQNVIADGANYVFASPEEDEPNAALFSKDNLTIYGAGSLTVTGHYNDGIASKDGLIIASGNITVTAADDGIRGKEYLILKDGTLTVTAGGDGLKSDEDEDTTLGYINIEGGNLTITSGGDAIQAETDVLITGGNFNITTGGGSNASLAADDTAKGIKGAAGVYINDGTFIINSADDAVHSNNNIVINNGAFAIATGDDGMHADANLEINNGTIEISQSYEGIESAVITINGGNISVASSDDGINVAGGDGSGFGPGGPGGRPPRGGQDTFVEYTGDYYLYINGGNIVVEASGDGVDVNGAIEMTAGTVIVNGPTEQMNGALDYDGTFTMTGGFFVAAGSAGMAQTPDISSSQNALLLNLNGTLQAGTLIHIEDSGGNTVLTMAPSKAYQSIALSSPNLVSGETYTVYYGGSDSGTLTDSLYSSGTYSGGTEYTSFTISSTVTMIGNAGRP